MRRTHQEPRLTSAQAILRMGMRFSWNAPSFSWSPWQVAAADLNKSRQKPSEITKYRWPTGVSINGQGGARSGCWSIFPRFLLRRTRLVVQAHWNSKIKMRPARRICGLANKWGCESTLSRMARGALANGGRQSVQTLRPHNQHVAIKATFRRKSGEVASVVGSLDRESFGRIDKRRGTAYDCPFPVLVR